MRRIRMLPLAVLAAAAACLLLIGALDHAGWMQHGPKPPRMGVAAWGLLFVLGWTLMTGAMMLPSSIPFLSAAQRVGGVASGGFAGVGYLVVWIALGACLWIALWWTGTALARLPPGAAENLAGASLIAAAAYQISPLARFCQRVCSRPFAIIARHWRDSATRVRNAAAAGVHYGLSCIGCCVPMIVLMFVVGMNDLSWMVALALLMVAQKHVAWGPRLNATAAAALAGAGIAIGLGWWLVPLHTLRELCGG